MFSPPLRLRIAALSAEAREHLGTYLRAVGAEVDDSGEALEASFEEPPAYLEDRVEAWLNLVHRAGGETLSTSTGGGPWLDGWRAFYAGADVAQFRIRPPWAPPPGDGLPVLIDPRGGFGSGLHPTTQLALRAMAEVGRPGGSMLDVGSGSGILSVAGSRLGMRVTALEIEAAAREATLRTLRLNGVEARLDSRPLTELTERFDLVVANLPEVVLRRSMPALLAARAEAGALVLGGFEVEDQAAVLASAGLPIALRLVSDDGRWACVALR